MSPQKVVNYSYAHMGALMDYNKNLKVYFNDPESELGTNESTSPWMNLSMTISMNGIGSPPGNLCKDILEAAMIKAFEIHLSKELAENSIDTPTISPKPFKDQLRPASIVHIDALYRFAHEAHGQGGNELRHSNLDGEKASMVMDPLAKSLNRGRESQKATMSQKLIMTWTNRSGRSRN